MNAQEKERHEEARWLSQRTMPLSESTRASYGSLQIQTPSRGLCTRGIKCLLKEGHTVECWPKG